MYHNILYPVYKLTLEITLPEYNYTAQHSYYFTLSFSDFMDEGKGKVTVDLKATNTPYSFANIDTGVPVAFGTKQYNFVGFKDLAALKKECVDKYLDKYTMENTQFPRAVRTVSILRRKVLQIRQRKRRTRKLLQKVLHLIRKKYRLCIKM